MDKDDYHNEPLPLDAVPQHVRRHRLISVENESVIYSDYVKRVDRVNHTAAYIWQQCDGKQTVGDVISLICSRFPEDAEQVILDIHNSLNLFHSMSLLSVNAAPARRRPEKQKTFHINFSSYLGQLLVDRGWVAEEKGSIADFSMSFTYNLGFRVGRIQTYDWFYTWPLRCKRMIYQKLQAVGHEDVMPKSFPTYKEFSAARDIDHNGLWFLKLSSSTRGKGVFCFTDRTKLRSKANYVVDKQYVIQAGIQDPLLNRGRKFTVRVYAALIGTARIYVHSQALIKTQPVKFVPTSTARNVQIEHGDADRRSSEQFDWFDEYFPTMCATTYKAIRSAKSYLALCPGPDRFQLFGLDFVISKSQGPLLLEVNDWPDLGFKTDNSLNAKHIRSIKQKVLSDLVTLLLDQDPGDFQLQREENRL